MAITVLSGIWKGQPIRKARKAGHCDCCRTARIEVGDFYMMGECHDGSPNPFATERWCMECAGYEARISLIAELERNK